MSQRGGFAETSPYFPHSFIYVFPFLMASGTFVGVTLSTKKPGPFNVGLGISTPGSGHPFYSIAGWVREPYRWIEWLLGVVFFGCGVVVLTVMIFFSARRQSGKTAGIALAVCCLFMGAGPMLVFRDDFLAVLAGAVVIAAGVVGFIRTLRSS